MAKDMTKGSVLKTILLFALPILVGQMLQMTYNIVDSMVVGRFIGEGPLAGVAATYTPVSLFNAVVLGFSTGASIIVAQYFGAGETEKLRRTFSTTYICVILGGLMMTVIVFFTARPLLKYVLATPEEDGVLDMAELYLRVYYCGGVFVFLYNMFASALRSLGDSVRPLWFLVVSCVANIVLDLLFVLAFNWGVAGVAAASVVSQGIACMAAVIYIFKHYPVMWYKPSELVFDKDVFRLAMKLGVPEMFNSCIMSICFMWQQRLVNSFGTTAMAAFLAGQRVDQLVGMPIILTGTAMAPFSGQNVGAGKWDRVYEGRRKLLLVTELFVFVLTPLLCLFGKQILSIFVSDPNSGVISMGYDYLLRIAPFFVFSGWCSVTNGVMRGAGDTRFATIASFIGLAARIGACYVLAYGFHMGINGIWLSTGVGFTINMIPANWRFYSGKWKTKAVVKTQEAAVEKA